MIYRLRIFSIEYWMLYIKTIKFFKGTHSMLFTLFFFDFTHKLGS